MDLHALKTAMAGEAERLARHFYPNGRREGLHWVAGDINGAPGRSFKVCLTGEKAGLCKDFASGEKAGTFIDVCMAVHGFHFNAAVSYCERLVGLAAPGGGFGARKQEPPPVTRPFDWAQCREALTDELLARFAQWRGYSLEHCRQLRSDGLLGAHDENDRLCLALPVHDPHGVCVGAQYFPKGSGGFYTKGATAYALIVGDMKAARRAYLFESPWDAFAFHERCGLAESEAIISSRGASHFARLAGRIPETAELVVFRQNDPPDPRTGRVADEDWFAGVLKTLDRPLCSVRVPARVKDLNDWTREGAEGADIVSAIDDGEFHGLPGGRPLIDLAAEMPDPGKTLLGDRFLCVGGGMLFVGPSGIGKSSASAQQDILWSLGREAFGIVPARPLRILTIQAENDDGDLGEMARGVCAGLDLTAAEMGFVRERVIYETIDSLSGDAFFQAVRKLVSYWKPNLLRIDPLFAYLGGDIKETEVTGVFLRQRLNPMLREFQCGAIICHHTPKPQRETDHWRASDWMYAGAGNADITNWARATLVIDPTYHPGVFRFIAAKRTARIGWKDEAGEMELSRHFCHAGGGAIFWRPADQGDLNKAADAAIEAKKGNKATRNPEGLLKKVKELVPVAGQIRKDLVLHKAQAELGVGINKARSLVGVLLANEEIYETKNRRSRMRHEVSLTRNPPAHSGNTGEDDDSD